MADLMAAQQALAMTNQNLEGQIAERLHAEREIGKLNDALKDRAEQLEASNKEIEAFLYSVSHDLRAPLRHVQGYAEMLAADASSTLSSGARRYLQVIAGAGQEMGELVDNLLAFLRLNRSAMHEARVDLEALARARSAIWSLDPRSATSCGRWLRCRRQPATPRCSGRCSPTCWATR